MSASKEVTIWCDAIDGNGYSCCAQWAARVWTGTGMPTVPKARRVAHREGWLTGRKKDGRLIDLCPKHAKEILSAKL